MTTLMDVKTLKTLTAAQRDQLRKDLEAAEKEAHAGEVEKARAEIDAVLEKYHVALDETHPSSKKAPKKGAGKTQKSIYFNPDDAGQKPTSGGRRRPAWLDEQIKKGNADKCLLKDPATGKPFKHTPGVLKAIQENAPKAKPKAK